jgi:hypothetical protein
MGRTSHGHGLLSTDQKGDLNLLYIYNLLSPTPNTSVWMFDMDEDNIRKCCQEMEVAEW